MSLFNEPFYLSQNPDVAQAIASGLIASAQAHFNTTGFSEGRDPNAYFDVSYYLEQYPDVAAAGINPLDHYIQNGESEGRKPSSLFDPTYYAEQYPDVVAAGMGLLEHYIISGANEGRLPKAPDGTETPVSSGNYLVVAYTDRNNNDSWDGDGTDVLIGALVDQDGSGTLTVGDLFLPGTVPTDVNDPNGSNHTAIYMSQQLVVEVNSSRQGHVILADDTYVGFDAQNQFESFYVNPDIYSPDPPGWVDPKIELFDTHDTSYIGQDSIVLMNQTEPVFISRTGDQPFVDVDFFI